MDIREIDYFDAPRPLVFCTLRDRYQDYLRYVPLVASVRLIESAEIDSFRRRVVTEWECRTSIPSTVNRHLKPEMIRWRIHSFWDESRWINDWRMETFYFRDVFECRGTLRFDEADSRTRCTLAALIRIDVPVIGPVAERYIVKNFLRKSLMVSNEAVRRLLLEESARGRRTSGSR